MLNFGKPPAWAEPADASAVAVLPGTVARIMPATGAVARAL